MNNDAMFSSKTVEWGTPPELFAELDREFHFTLDPCATAENAKCRRFFTQEADGLAQDWGTETVFMNPPYGSAIRFWMRKAVSAAAQGATVVCLVPARTDTQWWHECAVTGEVRFLEGRLKFALCLSDEQRQTIKQMLGLGLIPANISATFNLPKVAVKAIAKGKEDIRESAPFPSAVVILRPPQKLRIAQLAAEITASLKALAEDSHSNAETVITGMIERALRA